MNHPLASIRSMLLLICLNDCQINCKAAPEVPVKFDSIDHIKDLLVNFFRQDRQSRGAVIPANADVPPAVRPRKLLDRHPQIDPMRQITSTHLKDLNPRLLQLEPTFSFTQLVELLRHNQWDCRRTNRQIQARNVLL